MNTTVDVLVKVHCPICGHTWELPYTPRAVNDTLQGAVHHVLENTSVGAQMTNGMGHCDVCDLMVDGVDKEDEEKIVSAVQEMLKKNNFFYNVKSLKDAYELMVDFDYPDSEEHEMSIKIRQILEIAFIELCSKKAGERQPHPSAGGSFGGA